MTDHVPTALTVVAWFSLAVAFASAAAILADIFVRGNRQRMAVMQWVWPVTALYTGPLGLLAYRRWGRLSSPAWTRAHGEGDYGESGQERAPVAEQVGSARREQQ